MSPTASTPMWRYRTPCLILFYYALMIPFNQDISQRASLAFSPLPLTFQPSSNTKPSPCSPYRQCPSALLSTKGDDTASSVSTDSNDANMEVAWRHIKKPLLRIGSRGISPSHGNSLRELLLQHGVVKVKINGIKSETLEEIFDKLTKAAQNAGAPDGIELLRTRHSQGIVMCGMPGMLEKIENGSFPPPPDVKP